MPRFPDKEDLDKDALDQNGLVQDAPANANTQKPPLTWHFGDEATPRSDIAGERCFTQGQIKRMRCRNTLSDDDGFTL